MNRFAFLLIFIGYAICSAQYALRSYLYIIFHAIVGGPASILFEDKVAYVLSVVVDVDMLPCRFANMRKHFLSGESILCGKALSRAYLSGHRCISCCSNFSKVWKTSCLLHPCNAMLN